LRELAQEIAQALGPDWRFSTKFDAEDAQDRKPWRSRIDGPDSQALFLSNTWGPKGMLHVSGRTPDGIDHQTQVSIGTLPSINISLTKTPEQMAKDISRRLLPEYQAFLAKLFEQHRKDSEYKCGVMWPKCSACRFARIVTLSTALAASTCKSADLTPSDCTDT
jgi:hypothetical protein